MLRALVVVLVVLAGPAVASAQGHVVGGSRIAPASPSGPILYDVPSRPPPAYGGPAGAEVPYEPTPTVCAPDLVCDVGSDGLMHAYRRTTVRRVNGDLLGGGVGTFVGAYVLNVAGSLAGMLALSVDAAQPSGYLGFAFVPLAGPIGQVFFVGANAWQVPILAAIEALEIAGFVMAIVGQSGSEVETRELAFGVDLRVVPYASGEGGGLGATLRF